MRVRIKQEYSAVKARQYWTAVIASASLVAAALQGETNAGSDACIATVGAKHPGKMYDIECSAKTGRITDVQQEVETPDHRLFKQEVKIGLEQAKDIALKKHPGEIIEIEEDGKEMKVEADATSGAIAEANEELWQIGVE